MTLLYGKDSPCHTKHIFVAIAGKNSAVDQTKSEQILPAVPIHVQPSYANSVESPSLESRLMLNVPSAASYFTALPHILGGYKPPFALVNAMASCAVRNSRNMPTKAVPLGLKNLNAHTVKRCRALTILLGRAELPIADVRANMPNPSNMSGALLNLQVWLARTAMLWSTA